MHTAQLSSSIPSSQETESLKAQISAGYAARESLTPASASPKLQEAINTVLAGLNQGTWRVAEKKSGQWVIHQWLKQAILLSFKIRPNRCYSDGVTEYYDKVPLKFSGFSESAWQQAKVRVVPPAHARYGAFIAENTILMPSYINIGAYIGEGTMIDTWATVGSCAQIGKNVHISGGVGIGGVLEPLQANPTIIEDNCFIGARSEIVEGVIVEAGAVIAMGVFLGQSTRIYDRARDFVSYGRVPAGSVVVPGTLPGDNGKYQLACAVIVKQVDSQTRRKTAINDLLRDYDDKNLRNDTPL